MKKLNIFLSLLFLGSTISLNAQNVNIPDANFKAELIANAAINTNADTEIQVTEAQAFTGLITVQNKNISDLTGIEAFTALTELRCGGNQLTTLNISANTALTQLYCHRNQLSSLNVSTNTALTRIHCNENLISSLDVSTNTALSILSCYNNALTTLDVTLNTNLTVLECYNNQLSALNINTNTALTGLSCQNNQLTTLNASVNNALLFIVCHNNQLTSLTLPSSINCPINTLLCNNNQLTSLDLSLRANLDILECDNNLLTTLDLSANAALDKVYCDSNQLTTLNIKNGTNTNISTANFRAHGNPNLLCIEVDDIAYSNANWTSVDNGVDFNTTCFSSISTVFGETFALDVYPNPTTGALSIALGKVYTNAMVTVSNVMGQVVFAKDYNATQQIELDLDTAAVGVYFVSVRTEEGEATVKVVKE